MCTQRSEVQGLAWYLFVQSAEDHLVVLHALAGIMGQREKARPNIWDDHIFLLVPCTLELTVEVESRLFRKVVFLWPLPTTSEFHGVSQTGGAEDTPFHLHFASATVRPATPRRAIWLEALLSTLDPHQAQELTPVSSVRPSPREDFIIGPDTR